MTSAGCAAGSRRVAKLPWAQRARHHCHHRCPVSARARSCRCQHCLTHQKGRTSFPSVQTGAQFQASAQGCTGAHVSNKGSKHRQCVYAFMPAGRMDCRGDSNALLLFLAVPHRSRRSGLRRLTEERWNGRLQGTTLVASDLRVLHDRSQRQCSVSALEQRSIGRARPTFAHGSCDEETRLQQQRQQLAARVAKSC